MAAVAVLLAMYGLAVLGGRRATWALAAFVGSAAAMILPAHVVIAVLALVGVGSVWAIRIAQSLLATRRLPVVAPVWRRTYIATGDRARAPRSSGGCSPGTASGPAGSRRACRRSMRSGARPWPSSSSVPAPSSPSRSPGSWSARRLDRGGPVPRHDGPRGRGALVWGARLGDFNTFHLFFGGIAVFATPAAAVAVVVDLAAPARRRSCATGDRPARAVRHRSSNSARSSASADWAVRAGRPLADALAILAAIEDLPADAKLAYACRPSEEAAFWDAQTPRPRRPHRTAHRADVLRGGDLRRDDRHADVGRRRQPAVPWAPQRALYPTSDAQSVARRASPRS